MARNKNLTRNERLNLISCVALVILILTCLANFLFRYFVPSPAKWNAIFGFVMVFAIDVFMYKKYDTRLWVTRKDKKTQEKSSTNMTFSTIAMSNFLALTGSIALFPFWLAFNEEAAVIVRDTLAGMSFSSGKMIVDLITISLNVPVINLGLAFIFILMLLIAIAAKIFSFK
jgi:hypothetical protein